MWLDYYDIEIGEIGGMVLATEYPNIRILPATEDLFMVIAEPRDGSDMKPLTPAPVTREAAEQLITNLASSQT